MACGGDCNVVSAVEITIPNSKTEKFPKNANPSANPPADDEILATLKKEFMARMKTCEDTKCDCTPRPGAEVIEIDRSARQRNFTLYFPEDAGEEKNKKVIPGYKVTGKYTLKYKIQAGICEPNLNVKK